ncbi:hypothetical protein LCGC14_1356700 [marine sediment metagenome]|uniref:Uncharacterized protein n=1 Tax=marine sediment metagenome TaxID=412755 RepID=A0A0F9KVH5_9ZZZZ
MKIVIVIEGGVLQGTYVDTPDEVDVVLVEYDTEGADEATITACGAVIALPYAEDISSLDAGVLTSIAQTEEEACS